MLYVRLAQRGVVLAEVDEGGGGGVALVVRPVAGQRGRGGRPRGARHDDVVEQLAVEVRHERGAAGRVGEGEVEPRRDGQELRCALSSSVGVQRLHHVAVRAVIAHVDAVHAATGVAITRHQPLVLLRPAGGVHVEAQRDVAALSWTRHVEGGRVLPHATGLRPGEPGGRDGCKIGAGRRTVQGCVERAGHAVGEVALQGEVAKQSCIGGEGEGEEEEEEEEEEEKERGERKAEAGRRGGGARMVAHQRLAAAAARCSLRERMQRRGGRGCQPVSGWPTHRTTRSHSEARSRGRGGRGAGAQLRRRRRRREAWSRGSRG